MGLKESLYRQCERSVNARLQTIENHISSQQNALQSETKSSAGDKHETGRAMLQLEMEKTGQQLHAILQMKETLTRIDLSKTSDIVRLGSIIITNTTNYFLSISIGKLTVLEEDYFAISAHSPIGKLLLGKKEHEIVNWNGKEIHIKEIK